MLDENYYLLTLDFTPITSRPGFLQGEYFVTSKITREVFAYSNVNKQIGAFVYRIDRLQNASFSFKNINQALFTQKLSDMNLRSLSQAYYPNNQAIPLYQLTNYKILPTLAYYRKAVVPNTEHRLATRMMQQGIISYEKSHLMEVSNNAGYFIDPEFSLQPFYQENQTQVRLIPK
jgi:hypothetical protein